MENFAEAGLKVEDIDSVLCTHLRVDHVGWNPRLEGGRWVPTSPTAKYVFSKVDRDFFDPSRGEGGKNEINARVFTDGVLPILEAKRTCWSTAPWRSATTSPLRRRRGILRATC